MHCSLSTAEPGFDWTGLGRGRIDGAKRPLLAVVGSKGFAGCGYFNAKVCSSLGIRSFVRFSGVDTHEDFLHSKVLELSPMAAALGIRVGMSGLESLNILKGCGPDITNFAASIETQAQNNLSGNFNWRGLGRGRIDGGEKPLLTILGSKGFAGCGYFNEKICSSLKISTFIRFSGVDCHDDFLDNTVLDVSPKAADLGIRVGMKGHESLALLR
jgi:uncharacterized protein YunC (DUF1805 family)